MQNERTIIEIRKLAAFDIVFHEAKLILFEFAFATILGGVIGTMSLDGFIINPAHPIFSGILGLSLLGIGLNYFPLLLYAADIVNRRSASLEVRVELTPKDHFRDKYNLQSVLLLVPFAVFTLAVYQELQKRSHSQQ